MENLYYLPTAQCLPVEEKATLSFQNIMNVYCFPHCSQRGLGWKCTDRQGRDGKQVEKNHLELNKVIQRVSVTELNQQLG